MDMESRYPEGGSLDPWTRHENQTNCEITLTKSTGDVNRKSGFNVDIFRVNLKDQLHSQNAPSRVVCFHAGTEHYDTSIDQRPWVTVEHKCQLRDHRPLSTARLCLHTCPR